MTGPTRGTPPRLLTLVVLACAAAVVLGGIGSALIGRSVFAGTDLLYRSAPWQATAPTATAIHNVCVGDTVDSVIPQEHEFQRQLAAGHSGAWNPYPSGGTNLASTPDPAALSPLSWPYLALPDWLAPAYVKFAEMLVGIAGMFLYLRRLTLSPPAAVVGGIVFVTSGFMVTFTNWPQTRTAAFVPMLFWAAERFAQLRSARAAVPLALVLAGLLLGGFPSVTGYALYALVPYLLLRLWWPLRRAPLRAARASVLAGGGLAAGVALVGVQLLPFVSQLHRLDIGIRQQSAQSHLSAFSLVTLAVPKAFGSFCTGPVYFGGSTYNETEAIAYIGGAAIVLVALALLRRPATGVPLGVRAYLAVVAAVCVVLAYLGGPLLVFAEHFPVFDTNFVARIRSLLGFALAALAAFGLDALVRRSGPRSRRAVRLEVAAWVGVAAVWAAAFAHLEQDGSRAGHAGYVAGQLVLPVVAALVTGLVAALHHRLPGGWRLVALALVPILVAAQALVFVRAFWPRSPRASFYPTTSAQRFLAAHLGHDRYATTGLTMLPGSGSFYGLRDATGHAFAPKPYVDLLDSIAPGSYASTTFATLPGSNKLTPAQARSPGLDVLAVRYLARDPAETVFGTPTVVGGQAGVRVLHSGQSVSAVVPTAQLRAVAPVLVGQYRTNAQWAAVQVTLTDSTGAVLATSTRRLYSLALAGPFSVPITGEDVPARAHGPVTATIRYLDGGDTPLPVAVSAGGTAMLQVVTDPGDGLRLVFAGGAVLYQRLQALPRIRWATHAQVLPKELDRLTTLVNVSDPTRVVLSAPGPVASGAPATLHVAADDPEQVRVQVDAKGGGYLVLADDVQGAGWRATVDGRPAPLRDADEALVAVYVPAGRHDVRIVDGLPHVAAGEGVSLLGALVLAGLWYGDRSWRRRRRPRGEV